MKPPEPKHELVIKRQMSTTGGERTDIVASFRVPDQSAFAKKSSIVSANMEYRRGVRNYVTIGSPDIGPLIDSTVVWMDEEYTTFDSPWNIQSIWVMSWRLGVD
jgi:hypothetical protein